MRTLTPPIIVGCCICLHFWWAALILWDDTALNATALSGLRKVFEIPDLIVIALILAGSLSLIGLFSKLPWNVLLLMPQQVLLLMSASATISAMVGAHFADGIVRPHAFIMADQPHLVLLAIGHALAIINFGLRHDF